MDSLTGMIAFIFALVALGYLSGLSGLLKLETGAALSDFAVSVALPLLLFRTMVNADFSSSLPLTLWLAYFTAVAASWIVAQIIVVRYHRCDVRSGVVGGLSASFSNLVLLGLPFILGVFGQRGFELLSLIVSIHLPLMMGTTILLFGLLEQAQPNSRVNIAAICRHFLAMLFSSPLIIGILAGLLWRSIGLALPSLMTRLVDAIAEVAGPVALFAMGLTLKRYGISGNIRLSAAVTASKLILMPAIALLMAKLVGLSPLSGKVVVAAAALPCGINPYLIASRFGNGQAIASNAMTLGTACSVITMTFWVAVAEWAFG